jgi:hypothetical protein
MDVANPAQSQSFGNPPSAPLRALLSNAIRFWEPRRLLYNLVLTAVTAAWVAASWPHFRPALTFSTLPPLAVLALLANLCYSAAYFVDIPLQASSPSTLQRGRWALWVLGTLFAILLASYWINDEIYPDFR